MYFLLEKILPVNISRKEGSVYSKGGLSRGEVREILLFRGAVTSHTLSYFSSEPKSLRCRRCADRRLTSDQTPTLVWVYLRNQDRTSFLSGTLHGPRQETGDRVVEHRSGLWGRAGRHGTDVSTETTLGRVL